MLNPFYMADAVFGDVGAMIVGAEYDVGAIFILVGTDKGGFVPYKENAAGGSNDLSIGGEIGRLDFWGPENVVTESSFLGDRFKLWIGQKSHNWIGPGAGLSLSLSWPNRNFMTGVAFQFGFGASPFPIPFGINYGSVNKIDFY
jgi:hypothetical protein